MSYRNHRYIERSTHRSSQMCLFSLLCSLTPCHPSCVFYADTVLLDEKKLGCMYQINIETNRVDYLVQKGYYSEGVRTRATIDVALFLGGTCVLNSGPSRLETPRRRDLKHDHVCLVLRYQSSTRASVKYIPGRASGGFDERISAPSNEMMFGGHSSCPVRAMCAARI